MPLATVMRLAPAPDTDAIRCKKKINFTINQYPQPASVARRNARERNRVKQVNNGFATLRQHIPSNVAATVTGGGRGSSKKLSKVDTLRLAVEYIRSLQQLLDEHDDLADSRSTCTPERLTLPHTPPCSESSASPTPSYVSDTSQTSIHADHYGQTVIYQQDYHKYEPMSPEDEELLDVISWWQQQ